MSAVASQGWATLAVAWMLTYLVHSTLLLLSAWLIARALRDRPAVVETIWKAALVGGLFTATLQVGLGVEPASAAWRLDASPPVAHEQQAPTGDGGSLATVTALNGREQPPSPEELDALVPAEQPGLSLAAVEPVVPAANDASVPSAGVTAGVADSASADDTAAHGSWSAWLLGLWALGAAIGVVALVRSWRGLRRQMHGCTAIADGPLHEMLERLRAKSGFRGTVRLSLSRSVGVPMAVGLRRAEICVPPRAVESLDRNEQQSLLAHELAHVVRRDPAWRLVATVFERVLFFQPLNRLASRELAACSEFLCDAWAAAHTDEPLALAQCLAEVAGWIRPTTRLVAVPTMAAPRSILARRITRLVDPPHDFSQVTAPRWLPAGLASVLAIAVVAAPGVSSGHEVVHAADGVEIVVHDEVEGHEVVGPGYVASVHVVPPAHHEHHARAHEHDDEHDEGEARSGRDNRAEKRRIRKQRRAAKKRVRKAFRDAKKQGRARPSDEALLRAARGGDEIQHGEHVQVEIDEDSGVVIVIRGEDGSVRVVQTPGSHEHAVHRHVERARKAKQRARAHAQRARAHAQRARRAAQARKRKIREHRGRAFAPSAPPVPPGFVDEEQIRHEVERALRQAHRERQRAEARMRRQLEQLQRSRRDAESMRVQPPRPPRAAPRPPGASFPPGHFEIHWETPPPPPTPPSV